MIPILITKSEKAVEKVSLTITQKKLLTDVFVVSVNHQDYVEKATQLGEINRTSIEHSFGKKQSIINKVLELMRGTVVKEVVTIPPVDSASEATTETIYYSVPTTKAGLTKLAYTFFPDCNEEAFKYNIDMIVKWCDGEGKATWADFVNAFKTQGND